METSFEELMTIQSDTELELETQQRKLEELKPKVDQLQSSLSSVRKELDEAHAHNEMVQERNLKIRELKTKVETYKTSYKSLMNELEGMGSVPDTSDLEATLSQAVTELERMEAEAEAYEEEQHESDKHTDWLEKNEDVLLEKASNLETYEVMSSTLKKTEARMHTAAEAFTTAKNEETQAKNAEKNAVCGECQRPFDQKHLDAIQKKLPALTRKRNETQREFEKVESKVTELRTELAKLSRKLPPDDWKEQIDTHKALAAVSANRLAKLPSPSGDALITQRANVDELKARKKTIALEIKRHSEAKSRVAVAKENLDHNQAELNLTKPLTMVAVDGLLDRQGKAYEAWAEAREGLTATTEAVNALKRELADLNLRVKKARQHREETSTAEAAKARYTKFGRWLKENKAAFLNDTWSGILALVSEFSSEVTSGAIEEVGREPDGDFWYREDGHVRPILAASGGQRSIIGVGLRLALPSLLPAALGFVALDEASADLNEDHAAALAGALRTSGRQVILVTHRQGEEFSSDAVVVLE
jgi:exonuclease SbcC